LDKIAEELVKSHVPRTPEWVTFDELEESTLGTYPKMETFEPVTLPPPLPDTVGGVTAAAVPVTRGPTGAEWFTEEILMEEMLALEDAMEDSRTGSRGAFVGIPVPEPVRYTPQDNVPPDYVDAALATALEGRCLLGSDDTSHTVRPVVLVPIDFADAANNGDVAEWFYWQTREVQGFYLEATGKTFVLGDVVFVDSNIDSVTHRDMDWSSAWDTLHEAARTDSDTEILWVLSLGGGGYGGAYGTLPQMPVGQHTAMIGAGSYYTHMAISTGDLSWCEGISEKSFRLDCLKDEWQTRAGAGSTAHELGHTFDLMHEDDHDAVTTGKEVMEAHWNYLDINEQDLAYQGFSRPYTSTLQDSAWFFEAGDCGDVRFRGR
jgi:hypothetical protein